MLSSGDGQRKEQDGTADVMDDTSPSGNICLDDSRPESIASLCLSEGRALVGDCFLNFVVGPDIFQAISRDTIGFLAVDFYGRREDFGRLTCRCFSVGQSFNAINSRTIYGCRLNVHIRPDN